MKQIIPPEYKKKYNTLYDSLSSKNPMEKPLKDALRTLATALNQAQKEENFPGDLTRIVENVLLISDKNITLKEKEAALTALLEPPPSANKSSSTSDNPITHALYNATKAVACIAWAGACAATLGAFYLYTFPVGIAMDLGFALINDGKPPVATMMACLAAAPVPAAFPGHEMDAPKQPINSTAQNELKAAIEELRDTVSSQKSTDNTTQNEEDPNNAPEM
ncbi:MAG: hypothetical protein P1U39_02525 [Legionellaceae bacterium]|nr:hypothetical protein [Legionellaceae bacterium]